MMVSAWCCVSRGVWRFVGGSTQPTLSDAVMLFLREVLGGIGLGLIVGFITHYMLLRTNDFGNQLLITLATVTLGYAIALEIEVSGPIAMVVAGLLVGNLTAPRIADDVRAPIGIFWKGIDETLNSLLFVMMGFIVIFVHNLAIAPLGLSIAVAILVCLVVRAISVYIPLALLTSSNVLKADAVAMTKLFTWAGLRGGLALALALSLPESPEKALIVNMTFGVVAFSILVQGSTIGKLFSPDLPQEHIEEAKQLKPIALLSCF